MSLTERELVLPEDLQIIPATQLSVAARAHANCELDDFALTRPGSRTPSRIVDKDGAALLGEFRQPTRIVDAVVRFARTQNCDPEQTLEQSFHLLQNLVDQRFLLPAGSPDAKAIAASVAPGGRFADFEIVETIQVYDDTEVHQARSHEGEFVALKIGRKGASRWVAEMFRREADILRLTAGCPTPGFIASGNLDGQEFLAARWFKGDPIRVAATQRRVGVQAPEALMALSLRVVDAYAALHAHHVIHTDVHADNILVGSAGEVCVIDFGIARVADPTSPWFAPSQGGVAQFFDPHLARFMLGEGPPWTGSPRDEQYRLAALLYLVFTGQPYLDFAGEREQFMRQIIEEAPLRFVARGLPPWPELETVLLRGLAKERDQRFESLTAFGQALRKVPMPRLSANAARAPRRKTPSLVDRVVEELDFDGELFRSGAQVAPRCSINLGAGGAAYFFYRLAQLREEPQLLTLADAWSMRNLERATQDPELAFFNAELDMTRTVFGVASLHHDRVGLEWLQALIARAMGDRHTALAHARAFVETPVDECKPVDTTLGRSSFLLGAVLLRQALGNDPQLGAPFLDHLIRTQLEDLLSEMARLPAIEEAKEFPLLGIAHGWAGLLYVALLACKQLGETPDPDLGERLQQLERFRILTDAGLSWRGSIPGSRVSSLEQAPGWCAGSAGHVHLWLLASELFREPHWLDLALKSGRYAANAGERHGDLCCGLAGRAHALLRIYQHTGEGRWLDRARELGGIATAAIEHHALRSDSLYRGRWGVALLLAELDHPELAAMPLFASEGLS